MADLQTCQHSLWKLHYNQRDYVGNWTSISLRSASGRTDDAFAGVSTTGYSDTALLNECPYFREIISQFSCDKETIRLLLLAPGSYIREHSDPGLAYEFNTFRLHIPIQTTDGVDFTVADTNLPMQAGECWYANFHLPHRVRNNGKANRIHLVMDCQRNAWSDVLFAQAGYDFSEEAKATKLTPDAKHRTIEELRRLGTDTARQLADQLEQES